MYCIICIIDNTIRFLRMKIQNHIEFYSHNHSDNFFKFLHTLSNNNSIPISLLTQYLFLSKHEWEMFQIIYCTENKQIVEYKINIHL